MTSAGGPGPGLYFDPDGGDYKRFWNGEAWTEHRRSKPLTFNPPPQLISETRPHPRNGEDCRYRTRLKLESSGSERRLEIDLTFAP